MITNIMKCYYNIKYPYLNYSYTDTDGGYIMFSVPPLMLADEYEKRFHSEPKTFFDCGAATGMIVQLALDYGMDACGIDTYKYPEQSQSLLRMHYPQGTGRYIIPGHRLRRLFDTKRIEIKSILDCDPIETDIAYCNGVLTYFDEKTLPNVLSKFRNVGMLCAIHNTTEDIIAAQEIGEILSTCNKIRNIKPNDWWIETFNNNGFRADFDKNLNTFFAIPRQR